MQNLRRQASVELGPSVYLALYARTGAANPWNVPEGSRPSLSDSANLLNLGSTSQEVSHVLPRWLPRSARSYRPIRRTPALNLSFPCPVEHPGCRRKEIASMSRSQSHLGGRANRQLCSRSSMRLRDTIQWVAPSRCVEPLTHRRHLLLRQRRVGHGCSFDLSLCSIPFGDVAKLQRSIPQCCWQGH
jgi:hypothetical protein